MQRFSLRQLHYFVVLADCLSFTSAAQRLHITQPPLSQQIKLLEEVLGVELFTRTRRSVVLTATGKDFYKYAKKILHQCDEAVEFCRLAALGKAGKIRLAFTASVPVFSFFSTLLQQFRLDYPKIKIELQHMSTGEQLVALRQGQVDLGFLRPAPFFESSPPITLEPLWHDELMVVMEASHPLANNQDGVYLDELKNEGFILLPQAIGCGLFEHIMWLCNQAGFTPHITQSVREHSALFGLVSVGMGVSIVPSTYLNLHSKGVVFQSIRTGQSNTKIMLACNMEKMTQSIEIFKNYVLKKSSI